MTEASSATPLCITMHPADNVAFVANDGGLAAGAVFASGLMLVDKVPQGHKVTLVDLVAAAAVLRYNVVIGRATRAVAAGSWVHERLLKMPSARSLEGLPIATVEPPARASAMRTTPRCACSRRACSACSIAAAPAMRTR